AGSNEGFTVDYDLPNEQAYCETCASVGMVFWNQRMNSLTGHAEYMDVLERSLYNGALDGLSLSGDRFFYGNPLASTGKHSRKEWFGTACCPSNIARLISSLGNYIYGQNGNDIYVNLFVSSKTSFTLSNGKLSMELNTGYPWNGNVQIKIQTENKQQGSLHFRIPGWSKNIPSPGNLYQFVDSASVQPKLLINGSPVEYQEINGYARIERTWKDGDVVVFQLPMEIKKVVARPELKQNISRTTLQRGPLVYCVEGIDNGGNAWNIISPLDSKFKTESFSILDEHIESLVGELPVLEVSNQGNGVSVQNKKVRAIPYYTWCNRGSNSMQVWLPTQIKEVKINY
ncbi:MAG: hypothetical protein RL131_1387, partial [Bacteroidota bacterium]